MPRYKVDEKIYNIPEEEVDGFLITFPQAELLEEVKEQPTTQKDAEIVDVTQASNTELPLEDGSLELPEVEETVIEEVKPEEDVEAEGFVGNIVDFFDDIGTAARQGYMQGERTDEGLDLAGFVGEKGDDADVVRWIEGQQKQAKLNTQSYEMKEFDKVYEEAGGGAWGFLKAAAYNPSVLTTTLASSMASQLSSIMNSEEVAAAAAGGLATGAAAGLATVNPFGVAASGMAGAMSASMAVMEAGLTFNELMMEEIGGDINDPGAKEKVLAILNNEEKLSELKRRAGLRGAAIGAVELATMGLAKGLGGKLASKAVGKAGRVAAVGATEMTGGGLGEYAGRLVAGQEMDAKEIGFEAFAGLGSAPLTVGVQATKLTKAIQSAEISKKIRTSNEYGTLVDAYKNDADGNFKTNTVDVEISKLSKSAQILDDQVNENVTTGKLTQEEGNQIKSNFRKVQGSVNEIKSFELTTEQEAEAVDKLAEYRKFKSELKAAKGSAPAVTAPIKEKMKAIDDELSDIIKADNETKVEESVSFAKKAGKLLKIDVVDNLSKEQIAEQFDTEQNKFSEADGFYKDGKIYINKEVAKETGAVSVGSHELLHGIVKNSLMSDPNASKIIQDFRNELTKEQNAAIDLRANAKGKDGKRLYSQKDLDASPDEYLAFFSDAIAKNEIKFEENIFTKIGDILVPILRKVGFAKIKFNTGKDVYNFMREYNKSIKSGVLSEAIAKAVPVDTSVSETKISPQSKTAPRATILEAINNLVPTDVTTKQEFQSPKVFN